MAPTTSRVPCVATVLADETVVPILRSVLGTPTTVHKRLDDGRVELEVRSYSAERVASQLAGFGALVEVVSPEEARVQLSRIASELARVYD